MKLFLTSFAYKVMDEIIPLLPKNPKDTKVIFIPTAAGSYAGMAPWIWADLNKLKSAGFNISKVNLENKTFKDLEKDFQDVDIIFVAGGNTFYLLEKAWESGFDKILKQKLAEGVTYIGSSAGSVLLAPDIDPIKYFDDPAEAKLDSHKALGLVDFLILPHFNKLGYNPAFRDLFQEYQEGYKFETLSDNQFIIVDKDQSQTITI